MGVHEQLAPGLRSLLNIAGPLASFVQNLHGLRKPGKIRIEEFLGAAPKNFRWSALIAAIVTKSDSTAGLRASRVRIPTR